MKTMQKPSGVVKILFRCPLLMSAKSLVNQFRRILSVEEFTLTGQKDMEFRKPVK